MFFFSFEAKSGIMHVRVVGPWTVEEARRYGGEAGAQFRVARNSAGRLRLLLDLSQSELMAPEIIIPLMRAGTLNGRADDLLAAVTKSPELRLQVRRMFSERSIVLLEAVEDAADWLTAQGNGN